MKYVSLILLSFLMAGCCSVFRGTTETITIKSQPGKAAIYNDHDKLQGYTPLTITMNRGQKTYFSVVKDGYQPESVNLTRRIDWWLYPIDILVWPTLIVDYATDAMWIYSPDEFDVKLKPVEKPSAPPVKIPDTKTKK